MSAKKTSSPVKTIDDFRAAHDKKFIVPQKIQEAIDSLGPDGWEYENEFTRRCACSATDFSRFRGDFEDFCVQIGDGRTTSKRVWAGSKKLAEKMREMV